MPSTADMVKWPLNGVNMQILAIMPPQWCVDTRDTGILYVATLTTLRFPENVCSRLGIGTVGKSIYFYPGCSHHLLVTHTL